MEDSVAFYKKEGLEFVKFPKSYALYRVTAGVNEFYCVAKGPQEAIEQILANTKGVTNIKASIVCDVEEIYSTESITCNL
jgi:hypothetical protein